MKTVEHDIDGANFLDGRYYYDPAVFEQEARVVFPSSWVFVCDEQELPNPGDFVTTVIGAEPIVVLRDNTGEIKAFVNICPHRGSTLLRGIGNCRATIKCPYHGWRFGLDGGFKAALFEAGLQPGVQPGSLNLTPVRVEKWRRFVFVTLSAQTPSLAEWLEGAQQATSAYPLEAAVASARTYDRQPINWKLFWDINLDVYHIPTVHENSVADEFRILDTISWPGENNTSYAQLFKKRDVIPADQVLSQLTGPQRQGAFRVAVYPNFVATFEPNGLFFVSWVLPTGPEECVIGAISYGLPGADGALSEEDIKQGAKLMAQVQDEDYAACRRTSTGMRSRFYRPGPAHVLELQTERLHKWLRNAYQWAEPIGPREHRK